MIAISITTHENPRVIMELLSNVNYCYNGNAFLVVHVSADFKEAFYKHAAAKGIRLTGANIYWSDIEISTKWGNTLPCIIWNYLYLKNVLRLPFSHFQVLAPSNLVIRENMDAYILKHDIVMRQPGKIDKWMWGAQALADVRYEKIRQNNALGDPLCARIDGVSVRDDIFGDFVRRILFHYSISDLQNLDPNYPQEETILPTFLWKFKEFGYRFGESLAKTFEPNEASLDLPMIESLIADGKLAYIKRIAPQEDDQVRSFILRSRSYGRLL